MDDILTRASLIAILKSGHSEIHILHFISKNDLYVFVE